MFTVYYPTLLAEREYLLTYVHVNAARKAIEAHAEARLHGIHKQFASTRSPSPAGIKPGAVITVVPSIPGCICTPEQRDIEWTQAWHFDSIQFRAHTRTQAEAPRWPCLMTGCMQLGGHARATMIGSVLLTQMVITGAERRNSGHARGFKPILGCFQWPIVCSLRRPRQPCCSVSCFYGWQ